MDFFFILVNLLFSHIMSGLVSNYKILSEHNLIIEYHNGLLDYDSYINFKINESKDESYRPTLNQLLDFNDTKFNISSQEINKYANFLKTTPKFKGKRKIAVLTKTPNQVVPSTLLKMSLIDSFLSVEIFTTYEKAIEWLNIPTLLLDEAYLVLTKLKNA